jgi:hypothetical protein
MPRIKRVLRFLKYEQYKTATHPEPRNDTTVYSHSCLAKNIIVEESTNNTQISAKGLIQPVVFCDVMPYNQKTLKTEATDSSEVLVSTRLHGVTPGVP